MNGSTKQIVPYEDAEEIILEIYKNPLTGYVGRDKLFQKIFEVYWGINRRLVLSVISKVRAHSTTQQLNKRKTVRPIVTSRPYQRVQIDLTDLNLHKGVNRVRYLFTCVDLFSKFAWVLAIPNKKGPTVAKALNTVLDQMKKQPEGIQTDNGPEFAGEFDDICQVNGIHHIRSQAYSAQSQGAIERFNKTIKTMINRFLIDNGTTYYVKALPDIVRSYNESVHSTTGKPPIDLNNANLGKEQKLQNTMKIADRANKMIGNDSRQFPPIHVGDYVRISELTKTSERKKTFRKSTAKNWSNTIYEVVKIKEKPQRGHISVFVNYQKEYIVKSIRTGQLYSGQLWRDQLLKVDGEIGVSDGEDTEESESESSSSEDEDEDVEIPPPPALKRQNAVVKAAPAPAPVEQRRSTRERKAPDRLTY